MGNLYNNYNISCCPVVAVGVGAVLVRVYLTFKRLGWISDPHWWALFDCFHRNWHRKICGASSTAQTGQRQLRKMRPCIVILSVVPQLRALYMQ